MRFALAISALVLSGILLILGIGHATFLAGPKLISHTAELGASNELLVIDAQQLEAVPGQANIVVRDEEPFVGYGQRRDVEGWVAPFGYATIQLDLDGEALHLNHVPRDRVAAEAYVARIDVAEAEEGEKINIADLPLPAPAGSDLWLDERSLEAVEASSGGAEAETESAEGAEGAEVAAEPGAIQMVRMPVSLAEDQLVLVSLSNPGGSSEVTVEWVQNRRMPLVGPFLVAGGVFAVLGVVLYLIAVDHDRRGLGPRRGRKGWLLGIRDQFTSPKKRGAGVTDTGVGSSTRESEPSERRATTSRRTVGLAAVGLALAVGLSGCSPSYWPDFTTAEEEPVVEPAPEAPQNLAPVPVTGAQITRIISDVAEVAANADANLDANILTTRFRGDALQQRETNYTIRSAVSDYDVIVPGISSEILGYQLVQSTETWPRTMLVVVDSVGESDTSETEQEESAEGELEAESAEPESPSLALILNQVSPHENFMVSKVIALRGGITMPEAAAAEVGTAMLANDLSTLALSPAEVGPAYAAVLAGGAEVEQAENFDLEGDTLVSRSGAAWAAQATTAASDAGQDIVYSVSVAQSNSRVISLSTGVGGALVATTLLETRTEVPAEGSNWRPTVSSSMAALSGLSGRQDSIVSVVAHQLLFYVPSASSEAPIQLLGYTSDLVGASNG